MIQEASRYLRTLRYLRLRQVLYRLWLPVKMFYARYRVPMWLAAEKKATTLELKATPDSSVQYQDHLQFTFLNRSHHFKGKVDWNYSEFGKLWQYHLCYFDYLNQPGMNEVTGLDLMHQFIDALKEKKVKLEPYPLSLRCINWIKFIIRHKINDPEVDQALYAQFRFLRLTPEYHLMANHLLENQIALLWGAFYFRDKSWFDQLEPELSAQLKEQVLEDGAHFELAPMYHGIILQRLLDSVNLITHNADYSLQLEQLLQYQAARMLGWLEQNTFRNGDIPAVNDSSRDSTLSTEVLKEYAAALEIEPAESDSAQSGYHMIRQSDWELFVDTGNMNPDYNPGHSHCDALSFMLYHEQKPVIVDPGISTYEQSERRLWERSTEAHNTVQPEGMEQAEIWGVFRVGRRYETRITESKENLLKAYHDGYRNRGITHEREWRWDRHSIQITDRISGGEKLPVKAYLHFHPDCRVNLEGNTIAADNVMLKFTNFERIELDSYQFCAGFNHLTEAYKAVVWFQSRLETQINTKS